MQSHKQLKWLKTASCTATIEQSNCRLYKLGVMVHICLKGLAPQYLSDFCLPLSAVTSFDTN